jgi:signal peptidase
MIDTPIRSGERDSETRGAGATVRRVLGVLALLALIAVVVPFVIFAVPQVVGANHGFVILSGSMEPSISPGDVVIVDASRSIDAGDVISFEDGGEIPTTHRVIGVEAGRYLTQGDANEDPDSAAVPPDAVLGEVSLVIPLIGYVILWVNTPLGYVALVLVPIGLLLITELIDWARGEAPTGSEDAGGPGTDGPAPDWRHREDPLTETRGPVAAAYGSSPPGHRGVALPDLLLTTIASAVLLGYAVWNLVTEITVAGSPDPISMMAATAGLMGVLGGGWMATSVWLATRGKASAARTAEGDNPTASEPEQPMPSAEADGGIEPPTENER